MSPDISNNRTIRVLFFGTPDFAVPGLETLIASPGVKVVGVVTQPDRPAGRGGEVKPSPVKVVAVRHNIPTLQPVSIRKTLPEFAQQVAELGAIDIGVVIAFGQILPTQVLELPRRGCVYVHASLLPRWRGAAPIIRSILAGDTSTGVCLMAMDAGLDTGAVYARASTAIGVNDTGGSIHDRLAQLGGELLQRHLTEIVNGSLAPIPQPVDGLTYAAKVTSNEALLDWSTSAEAIDRHIRAFSPFPGAYTTWSGKRLKILAATPVVGETISDGEKQYGSITYAHSDRLEVACGTGSIRLLELQLEGKRRMGAAEFLRGNLLSAGALLGEPLKPT